MDYLLYKGHFKKIFFIYNENMLEMATYFELNLIMEIKTLFDYILDNEINI